MHAAKAALFRAITLETPSFDNQQFATSIAGELFGSSWAATA